MHAHHLRHPQLAHNRQRVSWPRCHARHPAASSSRRWRPLKHPQAPCGLPARAEAQSVAPCRAMADTRDRWMRDRVAAQVDEASLHHGGSFKQYMATKITKLAEQFEADSLRTEPQSRLFEGVRRQAQAAAHAPRVARAVRAVRAACAAAVLDFKLLAGWLHPAGVHLCQRPHRPDVDRAEAGAPLRPTPTPPRVPLRSSSKHSPSLSISPHLSLSQMHGSSLLPVIRTCCCRTTPPQPAAAPHLAPQIMALHGGRFNNYYVRGAVTHYICANLSDAKLKEFERARCVRNVGRMGLRLLPSIACVQRRACAALPVEHASRLHAHARCSLRAACRVPRAVRQRLRAHRAARLDCGQPARGRAAAGEAATLQAVGCCHSAPAAARTRVTASPACCLRCCCPAGAGILAAEAAGRARSAAAL